MPGSAVLQVGIVGKQRLARGRPATGHHPGVGTRLRLGARAHGKQEVHLGGVALGEHVALHHLIAPRGGEVAKHVERNDQAIDHAPGARLVLEQREFEWQASQVAVDEGIDAARVGRESGAVRRRQGGIGALGQAADSQAAGFAVGFERRGADHFRQVAGRIAAQAVHLPEAILGSHVSLHEKRVFQAAGANMRLPQRVERYFETGAETWAGMVPERCGRGRHPNQYSAASATASAKAIRMFTIRTTRVSAD